MNFSQFLLKTFRVKLSEVEVRMTLRELCGSKWDNYPFEGEVYENSFSIKENYVGIRRHIGGVVIEGSFYEENGKTTISIFPNLRPRDIVGYLFFALVGASILCYGMFEMFLSLLNGGQDFFISFLAAIGGGVFLGIVYSMVIGSYQRSIKTLQRAFRAAQRHKGK